MAHQRVALGQDPFSLYVEHRASAMQPALALMTHPEHPDVIGVVIDLPVRARFSTLIALPDGTATLRASDGDATFTGVAPGPISDLAKGLLKCAHVDLALFPVDAGTALPSHKLVQFTVLTPSDRRRTSVLAESFWSADPPQPRATILAGRRLISAIGEQEQG